MTKTSPPRPDPTPTDPVFMLGCPRSGTTLLASHLGRHPELLALPETHFFPGSYGGNALTRARAQRTPARYFDYIWTRNPRLQDVALEATALKADFIARDVRDPRRALDLIFIHALKGTGKHRVVEKTPRHINQIDRILRWYPHAKVLCVTRDGRDVVNSLIAAPWTHSNADRHTALWRWCMRVGLDRVARHPDRVKIVQYEHFVNDPEASLRGICDFIGAPYDAAMLDNTIHTGTAPEWERAWKDAATKAADSSMLYKWKHHTDPSFMARCEGVMRDELAALGLPLTNAPTRRASLRWSPSVFRLTQFLRNTFLTHVRHRPSAVHKGATTPAKETDTA